MSSSYTTNVALAKPAFNDRGWNTTLNTNLDSIDALAAVGPLAVATKENPSTSLNVKVAAGVYRKSDDTVATYAGTSSFGCAASSANYLYLTDAGVLTASTTGFPASTNVVRLATVVAGTGSITSITDGRVPWQSFGGTGTYLPLAGGTFSDGSGVVVVGCGTTNGTKIGNSSTDKIGLWGATPVVRPSGSAQAAITNSTGGTAGTTLSDVGSSFSQSTLNNNFATLWNLSNAIRSALVTAGIIKGSA